MGTKALISKRSVRNARPSASSLARSEARWGVICAAPMILGFVLWQAGPIVASLWIALTDWSMAGTPRWVGADNFRSILFDDDLFRQSVRVTLTYVLLSVPLQILVAFLVALLLNRPIRGLPVFRTIFYLPAIMPVVATSVLWLWMFNPDFGLLNAFLRPLGLPGLRWIYASSTVLPSLIVMSVWNIGGMMLIFLAGLQGVPRHLYEAVEVDGGTPLHQLFHVTLPMMTPTIFFNLLLGMINAFQTFTQPYIMTDGGPNNASLFYVLYLYRKAFQQSEMGYASALAWLLLLAVAVVSALIFRSSSRWVYYEGER